MDINSLKFSENLIRNLYPNVLIEENVPPSKLTQSPKKESKNYLGDNLKKTLIISSFENAPFITDTGLEFLTSVLAACKLSLGDVAILNLYNQPEPGAAALVNSLSPERVMLFGISTEEIDLPVRFPLFQKQVFKNTTYLAAPRLEDIMGSKELKQQLWGCLKNIFNL